MTEEETTTEAVLEKVKSRGYWDVAIRPLQFKKERLTLTECDRIVRECKVELRGWDYPHIGQRNPPRIRGIDYVESLTDWNGYKELWRMYQSGQFTHLFGCREDWLAESTGLLGPSSFARIKPGSVLEVIMTLFSATEIYEFAARLAGKNLFDEAVFLSITLHGMNDRKLTIFEPGRVLFEEYACSVADLPLEKTLAVSELLGKGHELALEDTIWIFERFNWFSASREILREDQKKLLERRF